MDRTELVDYAASLDCIHCGLCLTSCPTYRLTGRESSSPRGRVLLMRSVAEQRLDPDDIYERELDFCLVCRACESACPAGVRFGSMMESARDARERSHPRPLPIRLARRLFLRGLLPHRAPLRWAFGALRLLQVTRLAAVAARLAGPAGTSLASLPRVPPLSQRRPLSERTPARPGRVPRGIALVHEGCVQLELFGRVHRATVAVLAAAGIESRCPRERAACCGALHAHNGDLAGARELARRTLASYGAAAEAADAAVVSNAAGCGAHMKDYGRLLADDPEWSRRANAFAARVVDFAELVARHADALELQPPSLPTPVAWDDPCHLCHGQGVRAEPRALLDAVPGLERVELARSEACCGSAGLYALLRPADSSAVLAERIEAFRASGAQTLVTANPGCQMQWSLGLRRAGLQAPVLHLAEVLELALPPRR